MAYRTQWLCRRCGNAAIEAACADIDRIAARLHPEQQTEEGNNP
jgi:hypothetical protein